MVEIPLSSQMYPGLVALVDDTDYELVSGYTWVPEKVKGSRTFYASARVDGRKIMMHQLIMNAPHNASVDHVDCNGLNNTGVNLRIATPSQQQANQGLRSSNTSGFKGVSWDRAKRKWMASIKVNYKGRYLGRFEDPISAARAYDRAAIESFGSFARVNFPEMEAA